MIDESAGANLCLVLATIGTGTLETKQILEDNIAFILVNTYSENKKRYEIGKEF